MRVGHKINSWLNQQWAGHARKWGKFFGNKARRNWGKKIIRKELNDEQTGT